MERPENLEDSNQVNEGVDPDGDPNDVVDMIKGMREVEKVIDVEDPPHPNIFKVTVKLRGFESSEVRATTGQNLGVGDNKQYRDFIQKVREKSPLVLGQVNNKKLSVDTYDPSKLVMKFYLSKDEIPGWIKHNMEIEGKI